MPAAWRADPGALSVGLQSGKSDIVGGAAGADAVTWSIEIGARAGRDGALDFFGPLVHGPRGDRFLYVSWGTGDPSDHHMFRRLKLYLGPLSRAAWSQPGIDWAMVQARRAISAQVSGCLPDGTPNCGTAPALWRV